MKGVTWRLHCMVVALSDFVFSTLSRSKGHDIWPAVQPWVTILQGTFALALCHANASNFKVNVLVPEVSDFLAQLSYRLSWWFRLIRGNL